MALATIPSRWYNTHMKAIKKSELARLAGVSNPAISKAIKERRIPTTPDGLIDADNAIIKKYIAINREAKGNNNAYLNGKKHKSDSVSAADKSDKQKTKPSDRSRSLNPKAPKDAPPAEKKNGQLISTYSIQPRAIPKTHAGYTDLDALDSYDLDEAKLKAQIKKLEVETKIKEGQYVDRSTVEAFIGAIWSIDSSEWTQLGNKVAADLVAIVHATPNTSDAEKRVTEHINKTVYASLSHVKSILNDWLGKSHNINEDNEDE